MSKNDWNEINRLLEEYREIARKYPCEIMTAKQSEPQHRYAHTSDTLPKVIIVDYPGILR